MDAINILKVILLIYIIFVVFIEKHYLLPLHNNIIDIIWIVISIGVLLFVDIVLGIVLFAAWLITYIKVSKTFKVENHTHLEPEIIDYRKPEMEPRKDVCDGPPVPMPDSSKVLQQYMEIGHEKQDVCDEKTAGVAIQKYVVEDYLKKAAEDGIIEQHLDVYPNSMGSSQYNIQGIEKNIVGYNYKY